MTLHCKLKHPLHPLAAETLLIVGVLFSCTVISCFAALDGTSAKFLLPRVLMAHLLFYFSSVCLLNRFITFAQNNSFEITTSTGASPLLNYSAVSGFNYIQNIATNMHGF